MATLCPYSFLQPLDDNGNTIPGGLLYTYAAGTSTPKATYTSATEAETNANPVVLDSAGRANVWLGVGGYKLVLKSAAGVTITQADNVYGQGTGTSGFVATMADLRALSVGAYDQVFVRGYSANADGGEGTFYWNSSSTDTDDYGTVIRPNSLPATGRWIRYTEKYTPEMFGTVVRFLNWNASLNAFKQVVINKDLDLGGAVVDFDYSIISEINNGAVISNGTLSIYKFNANPNVKCFESSNLTLTFDSDACKEAKVIWWGGVGTAPLIAAFPNGRVYWVDTTDEDNNAMKYIGSDGVTRLVPLYNPSEV